MSENCDFEQYFDLQSEVRLEILSRHGKGIIVRIFFCQDLIGTITGGGTIQRQRPGYLIFWDQGGALRVLASENILFPDGSKTKKSRINKDRTFLISGPESAPASFGEVEVKKKTIKRD